jgi:hypothetical protein
VLFRLGRRAIGLVTGLFALLGFIAVPIGERTGYEHVKAVLGTPEGREAVAAIARAYEATRDRCMGWIVERIGRATATQTAAATKALAPEALLDGRDRDPMYGQGPARDASRGLVSHDEDGRTIARSGSRKDTGIPRREER